MDAVYIFHKIVQMGFAFINLGLIGGLMFAALILLRPVTRRLLTPRQQVILWDAGWLVSYLPSTYAVFSLLSVLPVTLRDLVTPRTGGGYLMPAYLPTNYEKPGDYQIAVPGGIGIKVGLNDGIVLAITVLWLAGMAAVGITMYWHSKKLWKLGTQGEQLEEGHPLYRGIQERVGIWLCDNIPTSFLKEYGSGHAIFLQKNLSPERRALVLKHEVNHIKLWHCRFKFFANVSLVVHWWNPIIWLAYFRFCRDLELDCDSKTMRELLPEERKEYAKTLVELGVGKQMWDAPLCFGECDAAVRVKALVAWRPPKWWRTLPAWGLTALVLLFCLTGGPTEKTLQGDYQLAWQRYVGEDVAQFVREQENDMKEKLEWIPKDVSIVHAWLSEEEAGATAAYELSNGSWRVVCYSPLNSGSFQRGYDYAVSPPDLSGYRQIL